ncbi:MAG: recombinase family protein [Patescibacteria group bacterium]|nr:recombinase family protein [Patescibacteria group bacterium]
MQQATSRVDLGGRQPQIATTLSYCLYARKSSESDERQALSIDAQINEMLALATREGLNVVDTKREAHSAKDTGQRPKFNEMVADIKDGKFNAILVWHPDRVSRNAGDLGSIVDLMDQGKLKEIRTFSQRFTNNPNEKFLLMILGSQAKLENDNKSVNVKRGLKIRCEMGLWPAPAPTGYLNSKLVGEKGIIYTDPKRAPIVKKIFEKVADDGWSGRKLFYWLKEIDFRVQRGKLLTLSNIYIILRNHFYYGRFEYPKGSESWYQGRHEPLISKELFDKVQQKLDINKDRTGEKKEFAFTKLMRCGYCNSGITADEKFKKLAKGGTNRYVYYTCTRFNDKECKNASLREEELVKQLENMIDGINLDKIGIKKKLKAEIDRFQKFQESVLGAGQKLRSRNADPKEYVKYILREGTVEEKRHILESLRSKIVMKDKEIMLEE